MTKRTAIQKGNSGAKPGPIEPAVAILVPRITAKAPPDRRRYCLNR
ncbi:MAG: hypothetical protein V3R87_10680 [Dehalococcoidia bacterium]